MGAIIGAAVGDAIAGTPEGERLVFWSDTTTNAIIHANAALRRKPIDIDLAATEAVPVAIYLSRFGQGPPLLTDPDTATLCEVTQALLEDRGHTSLDAAVSTLAEAAQCVRETNDFPSAVHAAEDNRERAALAGAIAAATYGAGSIPGRWAAQLEGDAGNGRTYRLHDLRRLTDRLLGRDRPHPMEPFGAVGPSPVAEGFWAGNLVSAERFVTQHPDGAVVSLCPTEGRIDHHPHRSEPFIPDTAQRSDNPPLDTVLDDVVQTIADYRAEGREVLVHCRMGQSRTGLALRAWLMKTEGLDEESATAEAEARWPHLSIANERFTRALRKLNS